MNGFMVLIVSIFMVFLFFVIIGSLALAKQPNTKSNIKVQRGTRVNAHSKTGHTDHTIPLPHNSQAAFKRNNERDTVIDPPLSQAEKNVLYGK